MDVDPFAVEISGKKYRLDRSWSCLLVSAKGSTKKSYLWIAPNGTKLTDVNNQNNNVT